MRAVARPAVCALGAVLLGAAGCVFPVDVGSGPHVIDTPSPGPPAADDGGAPAPRDDVVLTGLDASPLEGREVVRGNLIVEDLAADALTNFTVRVVEGSVLVCGNPELTRVNLRALEEIGGALEVCDDEALSSLTLPSLVRVGGDVELSRLPALRFFDLDALATVGGLAVDVTDLLSLSLPALTTVDGDVEIGRPVPATDALTTVALDALAEVRGDVVVTHNANLTTLTADALQSVGGRLVVRDNPRLDAVDLGALTAVGESACVCQNPALDPCAAEAALAALPSAVVDVTGNDGTCR